MTEPFVTPGTSECSDGIRLTGVSPLFDTHPAVTLSDLTRQVRGGGLKGGGSVVPSGAGGGLQPWWRTKP